jgi:hypothetical protein
MAQRSPAAQARTRRTLALRFQAPPIPGAPVVSTPTWAAVAVATGQVIPDTGPTWVEARARVTNPVTRVLVPRAELTEVP